MGRMCRYAKDGVTAEVVDAYRLPQLVRGWEWGLLRFLRARVAGDCHCMHHSTVFPPPAL